MPLKPQSMGPQGVKLIAPGMEYTGGGKRCVTTKVQLAKYDYNWLNTNHFIWCGRGELNYSIALITRNLLILHPGVKAQMPHNPASIVRLLYGERSRKRKPRRSAFSQFCQQQFDIRPSHRSRPPFENPSGHFSRRSSQTGIIAGTGLPLLLISHGVVTSEASQILRGCRAGSPG